MTKCQSNFFCFSNETEIASSRHPNPLLIFLVHFWKVAALMVSIITHAYVILDMLEETATEILMTAASLHVITVRLLSKGKNYRIIQLKKKKNKQTNNDSNTKDRNNKEEYHSIFREHINS